MTVHITWRNQVIDSGIGSIGFQELRGWIDAPDVRSSDADRSGRHGQIPGQLLYGSRIVEVDWLVLDGQMSTAMAQAQAMALSENPVEELLTISGLLAFPPQQIMCRPTHYTMPTARQLFMGQAQGTWQFKATDPRIYSLTEYAPVTGQLLSGNSGIPWPAGAPLKFGTPPSGGSVTVTNIGNADTWPQIILPGPHTGPVITDLTSGRQLGFAPTFTIPAGSSVVLDTDNRQVLLNGVSCRDQLVTAQWFPIKANSSSRLTLSTQTAETGQMMVRSRDAWL